MPNSQWTGELIELCQQATGLTINTDQAFIEYYQQDFGRLTSAGCSGVCFPKDKAQLNTLIRFANEHKLPLTPRGNGLTQGGQALAGQYSILVVLTELDEIRKPDYDQMTIKCQTGVEWGDLLSTCLPEGLVPKVTLPYRHITLGGTLAVGGIGSSSHHYGPFISTVSSCEIITGSGEQIQCTRTFNEDLFHASMASLGACGIITEAEIELRAYAPYTRTYVLVYDHIQSFLDDQLVMQGSSFCEHIEAFCMPCPCGTRINDTSGQREPFAKWFYVSHISFEYNDPANPPDYSALINNCRHRYCADISDTPTEEFIQRFEPRFKLMQHSGAWELAHPWLDYMATAQQLMTTLPPILDEQLPLAIAECRVIPINGSRAPKLFKHPPQENFFAFAILPKGVPPFAQQSSLNALENIHEQLLNSGCQRYLAGWLLDRTDETQWASHYDEQAAFLQRAKNTYDPNNILISKAQKGQFVSPLEV